MTELPSKDLGVVGARLAAIANEPVNLTQSPQRVGFTGSITEVQGEGQGLGVGVRAWAYSPTRRSTSPRPHSASTFTPLVPKMSVGGPGFPIEVSDIRPEAEVAKVHSQDDHQVRGFGVGRITCVTGAVKPRHCAGWAISPPPPKNVTKPPNSAKGA